MSFTEITTDMLDYRNQRDVSRILVVLLCFCLQVPGTCDAKLLQLDPPSIVVRYGSPASVNCSTNVTHEGMGWEASQGQVEMSMNVQLITWTVESLTHWDIQPICYMNVANSPQHLQNLNITIYKHPDQVSISTVTHTGPMIAGRQYELQCDVQNVAPAHLLTVNWYKGQELVKSITFEHISSKFPVNISSTLRISPSKDDDGVQYRCEAELKLGPEGPQPPPVVSSDFLNITVHFGPEFSNCPETLNLNEGQSLAGYCTVTGNPFPHSSWERNGHTIDPSTPLNRTSSGLYTIIINGQAAKLLDVQVLYGPEISCGPPYTVTENEKFIPNCTVEGNPPPKMIWLKDGNRVHFPHVMYKSDAGQYILKASNSNTIIHTVEIEVLYPPITISELDHKHVSIGKDVVLKCSSNAKPVVEYKWIYHRTSNVNIQHQDGMSVLYINHTGRQNIGTYTCIAYNKLGNTSRTVRVDVQGAKAECPLSVNPDHVTVEYGKSVNVTCRSSVSNANLHWTLSNVTVNGATLVINSTSFVVDFMDWNGSASCHGHFTGLDNCQKDVNIIVYKPPDSVSISTINHTGPVFAGSNYELKCDVQNVAPVKFLTVNWYQGQDLVDKKEHFNAKDPANIISTLSISPNGNDDNMQYSCKAELKLGPANYTMESLDLAVHYKPVISEKLPRQVPVFHGYPVVLVCEARGYPKPTIKWTFNNEEFKGGNLTVTDKGGDYMCIATNSVGNDSRVVTVVLTEDYLPLIAGFVALVVVIISVIFLVIYSIYYKNTKMGRYTVEGAKPKAQNGNVAQNGKDSTIPMKKIIV